MRVHKPMLCGRNGFKEVKKVFAKRQDEERLNMATNGIGNDLWLSFSCARVIYCLPLRTTAASVANGNRKQIIETVQNNDYKWLSICLHSIHRKWSAIDRLLGRGRIKIRSFQKYFVTFWIMCVTASIRYDDSLTILPRGQNQSPTIHSTVYNMLGSSISGPVHIIGWIQGITVGKMMWLINLGLLRWQFIFYVEAFWSHWPIDISAEIWANAIYSLRPATINQWMTAQFSGR